MTQAISHPNCCCPGNQKNQQANNQQQRLAEEKPRDNERSSRIIPESIHDSTGTATVLHLIQQPVLEEAVTRGNAARLVVPRIDLDNQGVGASENGRVALQVRETFPLVQ